LPKSLNRREFLIEGVLLLAQNPYLAAVLSLLVPGLGQIYAEAGDRGTRILVSAIVVGNLYVIWLSVHAIADATAGQQAFWVTTLPRLLHDVLSIWGLVFWLWVVVDAYRQAKRPGAQTTASA
jgi:hypothetical protein